MAKYFWGSNPFPLPLWGLSMVFAAIMATITYELTEKTAPVASRPHCGPVGCAAASNLSGVVLVTLGWVLHYYNTIGHQVGLKFTNAFVPHPQAAVVGERGLMNTLEQGIVFLPVLWMHAVFVDVPTSVSFGALYVVFRFLYPVLYALYGHFTVAVEIATSPNYAAIFYMAVGCLLNSLTPENRLIERLDALGNPFFRFLVLFVIFPVLFVPGITLPTGILCTVLNNNSNPKGGTAYHEEEHSDDDE